MTDREYYKLCVKYPRIMACLIDYSIGYLTVRHAAQFIVDYKTTGASYCEWTYSCVRPSKELLESFRSRGKKGAKAYDEWRANEFKEVTKEIIEYATRGGSYAIRRRDYIRNNAKKIKDEAKMLLECDDLLGPFAVYGRVVG